MHYEIEYFVEFFDPPVWVALENEDTGHPRMFLNVKVARRVAQRLSRSESRRIVLVRNDGSREVIDPDDAQHGVLGSDPSPAAVSERSRQPWWNIIRRFMRQSR